MYDNNESTSFKNQTSDESDPRHDSPGALHVALNTPIANLSHNQVLVFDDVRYDPTQAYDQNTGMVHCPDSGTYMVNLAAASYVEYLNNLELKVMKNEEMIGRVTARNPYAGQNTGSQAMVVNCNYGDTIYVTADNEDQGSVAVWGHGYTTLTLVPIATSEVFQCS